MPPKLPKSLYAEVAPLPPATADHLLLRLERKMHTSEEMLIKMVLKEVREKRETAFFYMNPFVLSGTFTTARLLDTLSIYSPTNKRLPRPTLSYWSRRGLVHFEAQGKPDPHSAAALLIARLIDDGERNFLPEIIAEEERSWWCFAQESPQKLPISLPVSHLDELPSASLVWTPWSGAAWSADWILIRDSHGNDRGAIRWSGLHTNGTHREWNISLETLLEWDTSLAHAASPALPEVIQLLATLTLHRLGASRKNVHSV